MDQTEITNTLIKALMSVAVMAISDDADELKVDLKAAKHEARKALEIVGYDFEMLMGGNSYLGTKDGEA